VRRRFLVAVTLAVTFLSLGTQAPGQTPAESDLSRLSTQNVKLHGAKGDGLGDDTAAIAAAIAAGGNVFDGTSKARVIYFPVGTYRISSTIEVPPNVILRGAGRFSTNLTGSTISVNFDGVGVRLVRRNATPGSLFHLGGLEDLAFTGLGEKATTASRFVEIGDSRAVNATTGAWNVFVRRCVLSYSNGYGIYAAHSQEALIDENWFRSVKFPIDFPTVVGMARITRNTLLDESRILGAIAMQFRPGPLGGAMAPQITQNYFLGFEYGIWLTSMVGPTVVGNAFEGTYRTPIVLSNQLSSGATPDGAGTTGFTIEGNTFINWAASAGDFPAIQLTGARGGFVGPNAYQSPNGAATTIINYRDGGPQALTRDNILVEPVLTGSGNARPFPLNSAVLARNSVLSSRYFQPRGVDGDPATTGLGPGEGGRTWWDSTTRRFRVWDGAQVQTLSMARRVTLSYGPVMRVDAALGAWFSVTATDRSTVAIADVVNGTIGQVITITIRNASGGELGRLAWGPGYKLGNWVSPANGSSRSISFGYDGAHWVEIGRTTVDVPN